MQELSEVRFVKKTEYGALENLWKTSFDDSEKAVDAFFEKTVSEKNVLAVFCGECAVSALYMLESEIATDGEIYPAYYIYAVCTHPDFRGKGIMKMLFDKLKSVAKERGVPYLFLVPESESLFAMYSKIGFCDAFVYKTEVFTRDMCESTAFVNSAPLKYDDYRSFCLRKAESHTVAVLKEKAFNSFCSSVDGSVESFCTRSGYAVYENGKDGVTVFEFYGDKTELVDIIFSKTGAETVELRTSCTANESGVHRYGMYAAVADDVLVVENAFFGIPYST